MSARLPVLAQQLADKPTVVYSDTQANKSSEVVRAAHSSFILAPRWKAALINTRFLQITKCDSQPHSRQIDGSTLTAFPLVKILQFGPLRGSRLRERISPQPQGH